MLNNKIEKLNSKDAEIFKKFFIENGEFPFEGCWLRDQRKENAKTSGYIDETTKRRRFIHFYNTYNLLEENGDYIFNLKNFYIYVTNTLPKNEVDEYLSKILKVLKDKNFEKTSDTTYLKDNFEVVINLYKIHPQNTSDFPQNYLSCDIVLHNKGYEYKEIQDRMWKLSRKNFRKPDKRENPKYVYDAKEILKYLPAQVEMGCGPSIDAGIPPLHEMHEIYRVQNHITGKFYFSEEDTLILDILKDPNKMFKKFSQTPLKCIRARHTQGYLDFKKLYDKGLFKGIVYNNNFDRLVKRLDIPEQIIRTYSFDTLIPTVKFDKDVKSLICIGCHADRRKVQKQAREQNLKIIFIDPEGFYTEDGFDKYLIEGPQNDDIIYKTTFENAMVELGREFYDTENSRI